jgi:hypothetical protein
VIQDGNLEEELEDILNRGIALTRYDISERISELTKLAIALGKEHARRTQKPFETAFSGLDSAAPVHNPMGTPLSSGEDSNGTHSDSRDSSTSGGDDFI